MKTMKTVENLHENHCRTNENLKTLDSLNIKRILILFHIYKCKGFQGFHVFCNGFHNGFQRFSWLSHVPVYNAFTSNANHNGTNKGMACQSVHQSRTSRATLRKREHDKGMA